MSGYLIGGSLAIKRIRSLLKKLPADTSPLVITGEPGVGKTFLAKCIHDDSLMNDRELEIINFKILSERDQRMRLLGGSPPDLPSTRRSTLELSTTVVLKHIDCASEYLQERLAEAILRKEIIRLGTNQKRPVKCRPIFVLYDHPQNLSKTGSIIPELAKILLRFQVILMPTIKERKDDIKELAQHFATQFQIERYKKLDKEFIEMLMKHKWKSNILEFKAFIKALDHPPAEVLIDQNDTIGLSMMNMMIDEAKEFSLKDGLSKIGDSLTRRAWKRHNKNNTRTSQVLGTTERSIRRIVG
jgi:transcriptional regulator of aroF, aroG, tyrA and aromatic amino acid transport